MLERHASVRVHSACHVVVNQFISRALVEPQVTPSFFGSPTHADGLAKMWHQFEAIVICWCSKNIGSRVDHNIT
jgi:hypothetical protein